MAAERIPILFDTDIGSDIDDAVALAYLLKEPRCELLGVTTVTGEPMVRAQMVDAMCQAFGRKEVPIYSGAGEPLLIPQIQKEVHQRSALEKWPHREKFAPNVAVDFLRETIRSRPGEITLLSVGPLTNVGLLFATDREIPKLLKNWVLMGGEYVSRPPMYGLTEWNIIGDPHAAAIAFGSPIAHTRCIGLDVTTKCTLPADDFRKKFSQGPLRVVLDMAEVWFQKRPTVTFHDPLAAVCVFEPDVCKYVDGRVSIELQSDKLKGLTLFDQQASPKPHHVATEVDAQRFFTKYFTTIGG
jgi:purine nucleosidase